MKVLILSNNDLILYKFRKELLLELLAENIHTVLSFPRGPFVKELQSLCHEYFDINLARHGKNPLQEVELFFDYYRLIKKVKPDIVLTYTIKPNVYGGMACKLSKIPYIVNVTGLGISLQSDSFLAKILIRLYRQSITKASAAFFQNGSNLKYFSQMGIDLKNCTLLPGSGVNLQEFCYSEYPEDCPPCRFLFLGRLMKDKGIYELLESIKMMKTQYSNVFFDLVGMCDDDDVLPLVEDMASQDLLVYHGLQKDVKSYISSSHAVVLPSYHEGLANVLLESASMGRPVIASNIPGCQETFEEGVSGFGFQPKDAQDLFNALERFLNKPYEEKKAMGIRGRQRMEKHFSRDFVIQEYMSKIKEIRSSIQ